MMATIRKFEQYIGKQKYIICVNYSIKEGGFCIILPDIIRTVTGETKIVEKTLEAVEKKFKDYVRTAINSDIRTSKWVAVKYAACWSNWLHEEDGGLGKKLFEIEDFFLKDHGIVLSLKCAVVNKIERYCGDKILNTTYEMVPSAIPRFATHRVINEMDHSRSEYFLIPHTEAVEARIAYVADSLGKLIEGLAGLLTPEGLPRLLNANLKLLAERADDDKEGEI